MASLATVATFYLVLTCPLLYLSLVIRAVPARDVTFVLATFLYAAFANQYILGAPGGYSMRSLRPSGLTPMKRTARLLFPFTLVLSFAVPIVLLVRGVPGATTRPTQLDRILAPHLFLMTSQILLEAIGFFLSRHVAVYIRFCVTTAFVSYRIPVIFDWYEQALLWPDSEEGINSPAYISAAVQIAAVLNAVFWLFALLCFLLLYCLPGIMRDPQIQQLQPTHKKA